MLFLFKSYFLTSSFTDFPHVHEKNLYDKSKELFNKKKNTKTKNKKKKKTDARKKDNLSVKYFFCIKSKYFQAKSAFSHTIPLV